MYAIGITQSDLLPPLLNQKFVFRYFDPTRNDRDPSYINSRKPRYAAAVYKAVLNQKGQWFWKRTEYVGETRKYRNSAMRDAAILSEMWGQCRIYKTGLGNTRIQ